MRLTIFFFLLITLFIHADVKAQAQATEQLNERYKDALTLYFYKNTLRMLNQTEDPEFDELIKDVEKLKFLMIDKGKTGFGKTDYTGLVNAYKKEKYEEMLTSRMDGRKFDVYIKEESGRVKGTILLVSDSTSLFVLDVLGRVAVEKAGSLFKTLDGSSEIGNKISDFLKDKPKKKKDHIID
jgi:hypothetical protein